MKKIEFVPMTKFREQLLIQNEFIESIIAIDNAVTEVAGFIGLDLRNFRNYLNEKIEKFIKLYRQRVNFFVADLRRFVGNQIQLKENERLKKLVKKFNKNLDKIKLKNDILGAEMKSMDSTALVRVIEDEFKFLKVMIFPKIVEAEEDIIKQFDRLHRSHFNSMRLIQEIEDLEGLSRRKGMEFLKKNQCKTILELNRNSVFGVPAVTDESKEQQF